MSFDKNGGLRQGLLAFEAEQAGYAADVSVGRMGHDVFYRAVLKTCGAAVVTRSPTGLE